MKSVDIMLIASLIYQRDNLLKRIYQLLNNFDAELRCLRHDKFMLDIDMKNADLRYFGLLIILNFILMFNYFIYY